jgi:beta-glucosidase
MLAGGINLARDPRNGRNFEYLSEDPLLSGVLAGRVDRRDPGRGRDLDDQALLAELQRDQPPLAGRDHRPAAHRESDLLAFEIAIERGQPGSVMTGYNKVNGDYAGATGSCSRTSSRAPGATRAG